MNRRRFLIACGKGIMLGTAATGAAFPAFKTSHVIGANNRIKLGLIGCGDRGDPLARGFINDGVEISYVCDFHTGRMVKMAQIVADLQGKAPKRVKDLRKILDDKEIDAVVIVTPNHQHALPMIWSCQAGKDVYLEKPQSNNIWEGRKMIEAAQKYHRIVQIGAQNRSAPYIQAAKEYIDSGKLGDIHLVKVFNLKPTSSFRRRGEPFILDKGTAVPNELDWDAWLGGTPYRPYSEKIFGQWGWIAYWDFSAGTMDDGIHQLDIALRLMGEPTPTAVSASGGKLYFKEDDAQIPDVLVNSYDFDNFIMTMETSGYPQYMRKTTTTIRRKDQFPYWTQNSTRIEFYGSKELMILGRMGGGWITMTSGGKIVEKMYGRVPDAHHRQNFIECLKNRKRPNGDIEIVNNSTNVAHIGNIAHRIGNKKLYFDKNAERFIDNDEANALLKYAYREKYSVPNEV